MKKLQKNIKNKKKQKIKKQRKKQETENMAKWILYDKFKSSKTICQWISTSFTLCSYALSWKLINKLLLV